MVMEGSFVAAECSCILRSKGGNAHSRRAVFLTTDGGTSITVALGW